MKRTAGGFVCKKGIEGEDDYFNTPEDEFEVDIEPHPVVLNDVCILE
jgi:hypothetical protein